MSERLRGAKPLTQANDIIPSAEQSRHRGSISFDHARLFAAFN